MIDFIMAVQIFFLLNPLTAIPLLFTAHKRGFNVKNISIKATLLAFVVAIVFVLVGPLLFKVFNITVNSFRAAGGILIMLLGLSMAKGSDEDNKDVTQSSVLVSLLATPLLTGPATLSYLALKTAEVGLISVLITLPFAFIMVAAVFLVTVYFIPNVNLDYVSFVSRIFGLFLLSIGLEMLVHGIKGML